MRLMQGLAMATGLIAAAPVGMADTDPPLVNLAKKVPADAKGWIVLNDLAAVRRQVTANQAVQDHDPEMAVMASFAAMYPPSGFDVSSLMLLQADGAEKVLGFSPAGIDQLAGWGTLPDTAVVLQGRALRGIEPAMDRALAKRGFQRRAMPDLVVWSRGEDNAIDLGKRHEDPFTGRLGRSVRLALRPDHLIAAPSWAGLDAILAPSSTLMDKPDSAGIVGSVAKAQGLGDPAWVLLLGGQGLRRSQPMLTGDSLTDPKAFERLAKQRAAQGKLSALPFFGRYGIASFLDGRTLTGAILLPYRTPDQAETAAVLLHVLFESMISPLGKKPFAEVMKAPLQTQVVQTRSGTVVIGAFSQTIPPTQKISTGTYISGPAQRLLQMIQVRELDLILGR